MKKLFVLIYLLLNIDIAFAANRAEDLGSVITLEGLRTGLPYTSTVVTSAEVNIDLGDHVRAVLIASITDQISYGASEEEYQRLSEMIYRSYIEIQNIGGSPVALIIGKFASEFGTEITNFRNYIFRDEFELTSRSSRVLGLAVEIEDDILGFAFQASIYRPYINRDQNLGLPGGSYSFKKEIIRNLVLKYSSMINLDLQRSEVKRSLELIYAKDKIRSWVNIQNFENVYMGGELISGISTQIGSDYSVTDKIKLVIQYSIVESVLSKLETGVEFELIDGRLYLFPSYSRYDRNGEVEDRYGLLFRYRF